jgi:tetratricopeptide (TPR) repeat protein
LIYKRRILSNTFRFVMNFINDFCNSELVLESRFRNLKAIPILSLFFLLYTGVYAQQPKQLFQQANQAYQAQDFQQAIDLYQKILGQGYQGKEIYYNLGNAYFRLNNLGQAILNYEKALKLDPNDPDVRYNLELANLRVVDRLELPPRFFLFDWWDSLKTYFSLGQLTRLVAGLFILSILLVVFWLFTRRYRLRRWLLTGMIICSILFFFWTYILIKQSETFRNHRQAVVLTPSITVMSAPDEASTDVFLLHEGVKIRLDEQRETWVKISLPDGKSGWIKTGDIGII